MPSVRDLSAARSELYHLDTSLRSYVRTSESGGQARRDPLHEYRRRLDVLFVGRQLGHKNPTTTLVTYAPVRDGRPREAARRAVEGAHQAMGAGLPPDL